MACAYPCDRVTILPYRIAKKHRSGAHIYRASLPLEVVLSLRVYGKEQCGQHMPGSEWLGLRRAANMNLKNIYAPMHVN
jgi:hypothetical protein